MIEEQPFLMFEIKLLRENYTYKQFRNIHRTHSTMIFALREAKNQTHISNCIKYEGKCM
jgi:hypothetical protein